METTGRILQVLAFVAGVIGVLAGIGSNNDPNGSSAIIIVVSVTGAFLLFGIGAALAALDGIANDTRRSAVANERIVQAVEQIAIAGSPLVVPNAQRSSIDKVEVSGSRNKRPGSSS